eukprot:5490503-Prymnesium_polylepis.1
MFGRDADYTFFDEEHQGASTCYTQFLQKYPAFMCPTCKRRGVQHCVHQASFRMGNTQTAAARKAPSLVREDLCTELWERVKGNDPMASAPLGDDDVELAGACGDGEAECVRQVMTQRAHASGEARFCGRRCI